MSPLKIERITPSYLLGEGPHWDVSTRSLYYVNIFGHSVHRYIPSTQENTDAVVGEENVTFIVPVEGAANKFVIGYGTDIVTITWDGISKDVSDLKIIAKLPSKESKFNDGKVDPTGRLWTGTIGYDENGKLAANKGTFYSLDSNGELKEHVHNVHISNGLAWDEKINKFYYIDSGTGTIDSFDFDGENARISNRQTVFTVKEHNLAGLPDGQTIDADGNLWVALFGGKKVIQIDPRIPETLLKVVELPAKQVTSVAFGGPNLDELYVTTARFTMDATVLDPPDHGATYRITGLGVKGLPAAKAKL